MCERKSYEAEGLVPVCYKKVYKVFLVIFAIHLLRNYLRIHMCERKSDEPEGLVPVCYKKVYNLW